MELAVAAVLRSIMQGIPLGLYVGLYPDHTASRAITAGSILGFSLPTFWIGLMLIIVFAVELGWLPYSAAAPPRRRSACSGRSSPGTGCATC